MPSRYTSPDSLEDAALLRRTAGHPARPGADRAGAWTPFTTCWRPVFANRAPDTTEENIQSRIRGVILMAISNKLGPMVLTTGNKSEMSVGYATLYGDMCGGYSVLKDVYKTTVFALARWRNAERPAWLPGPVGPVVPERVITKPPTAELRDNQKDEDSLPPYEVLDQILDGLVEQDLSPRELVDRGLRRRRRCGASRTCSTSPSTSAGRPRRASRSRRKAFGRDRRYPITNAFRRIGLAALSD